MPIPASSICSLSQWELRVGDLDRRGFAICEIIGVAAKPVFWPKTYFLLSVQTSWRSYCLFNSFAVTSPGLPGSLLPTSIRHFSQHPLPSYYSYVSCPVFLSASYRFQHCPSFSNSFQNRLVCYFLCSDSLFHFLPNPHFNLTHLGLFFICLPFVMT